MAKPPSVAMEGSLEWAPPPIQGGQGCCPKHGPLWVLRASMCVTMAALSMSTEGPEETTRTSSIISHPTTSALPATWDPSSELRMSHIFLLLPAGRSPRSCLFPNTPHVCCGEHEGPRPSRPVHSVYTKDPRPAGGLDQNPVLGRLKKGGPSLPVGLSYASICRIP